MSHSPSVIKIKFLESLKTSTSNVVDQFCFTSGYLKLILKLCYYSQGIYILHVFSSWLEWHIIFPAGKHDNRIQFLLINSSSLKATTQIPWLKRQSSFALNVNFINSKLLYPSSSLHAFLREQAQGPENPECNRFCGGKDIR